MQKTAVWSFTGMRRQYVLDYLISESDVEIFILGIILISTYLSFVVLYFRVFIYLFYFGFLRMLQLKMVFYCESLPLSITVTVNGVWSRRPRPAGCDTVRSPTPQNSWL